MRPRGSSGDRRQPQPLCTRWRHNLDGHARVRLKRGTHPHQGNISVPGEYRWSIDATGAVSRRGYSSQGRDPHHGWCLVAQQPNRVLR